MKKIIERVEKLEKDVEHLKQTVEAGKPFNVACNRCDYKWLTRTKFNLISCPSCGAKVRVNQ